jgi:hypothetical protein
MASLRKRYRDLIESDVPVTVLPTTEVAKPPPVTDAPKPAEEIAKTESSPVEQAARSALQDRLAEAERAAELAKSAPQPQPTLASEPQPPVMDDPVAEFERAIHHLPDRVKGWYRRQPQFLTDPERAAQITYAYHVAARETGEENTDAHLDRMEVMLGLRQQPQPQSQPERKASAPARSATQFSAPVHRDAPSMSSGRPASSPLHLTGEERQLARTLGLTDDQYRKGKERMNREKAGGFHQDGQ